jgi:conjugal transfer pilus assembly protein TraK
MKKHLLALMILGMSTGIATASDVQQYQEKIPPENYSFANDQTLGIKLSMNDQNRIIIKNDKIKEIVCARAGYCIKSIDPKDGDLLLGLGISVQLNHPFTVLIKTSEGRSFSMLVMPVNTISKTVIFTPETGSSKEAKDLEANTPYQALLAKIITSMINYPHTKKTLDGYSEADVPQQDIDETKLENGDYVVYPVRVFKGYAFVGITSMIKNVSKKKLILNPKEFYHHGVIAGAVSDEVLEPQQIGYSYQVWVNHHEE